MEGISFRETIVYRVTGRRCEGDDVRDIEEWNETRDEETMRKGKGWKNEANTWRKIS